MRFAEVGSARAVYASLLIHQHSEMKKFAAGGDHLLTLRASRRVAQMSIGVNWPASYTILFYKKHVYIYICI